MLRVAHLAMIGRVGEIRDWLLQYFPKAGRFSISRKAGRWASRPGPDGPAP
jgi:hypothetical protein